MFERVVSAFWNGRTRRLRAPWRLVAVFVVLALAGLGVAVALLVLGRPPVAASDVGLLAVQAVGTVVAVYLVGRFVDRRRFVDFGLHVDRAWWADLGFGLLLGAALMTGVVALELAAGWLVVTGTVRATVAGVAFWPWFAVGLATFVAVGVTEELLARGFLVTNGAEGLTWFDRVGPTGAVALAVVGSSLLFAFGHAANPNAGLASTGGILVASFLLAAGYVLTGELAIPIGVHVTWNFFQGPVFGLPVSGIDFGVSVLAVEQRGPALATGGAFGPEAGLLGVAASLVGIGCIAAWVRWRAGRLRVAPSIVVPERLGADEG